MSELEFLKGDAVTVAQELLGWRLYAKGPASKLVGGPIYETEAYTQYDAASHSFNGETPRTKVMFGPAAHVYVYFTYGMHWCMNIVVGERGKGEAVLIRALRLDEGLDSARERRNHRPDAELTNGPAKVCQALMVTGEDNGLKLNDSRIVLLPPADEPGKITITPRIGISKDMHRLWRFTLD